MSEPKSSFIKVFDLIVDAIRGTDEDLTKISINRAIILLAIPMVIEMMMEGIFAVVDAFFVSRISEEAVATVGITENVMSIIYSIAIGVSIAATAMVARRTGEGDKKAAANTAAQAILLAVGLAVLIGIFGTIFSEDILRLMGAEDKVVQQGVGYTRIMFGGNVVIILLFLLNGIFRGIGNANIALRSLIVSNGLNIILDPCLIFGLGPFPEMGIEGAAIATNIGRGTGVLFQLYILFNGSAIIKLLASDFKVQLSIIGRMVKVGAGGAGQYMISSASWIFLMMIITDFGTQVVAGYVIAIRVIIFAILPAWGMSNAAATLVGQNLGAGQPDRAEKSVWITAMYASGLLLVISFIFFFFAPEIVDFFEGGELAKQTAVDCLKIVSLGYFIFGFGMVMSQSLNGSGDTKTPTWINFFCFWLLQAPLAYYTAIYLGWGVTFIYWSVFFSYVVYAIIFAIIFKRGKWKAIQI
ncbi:MAG: MATE family efflux transporter [Bacteroidia bacterium]|nr:MATE family efflux transporter [Bacteroidia bacterium]